MNRNGTNGLYERMSGLEAALTGEMSTSRQQMNTLRDRVQGDLMMLMSISGALDACVSKLEEMP